MNSIKIAVASGKGGTGKTFFSTNLYSFLRKNRKVCLCDLDVEEPNSGIFIEKTSEFLEDKVYSIIPEIDKEKCNYCGKCSKYCQFNCLLVTRDTWMIFPELCKGCTSCIKLCPEKALSYGQKENGVIRNNKNGFLEGILKKKEPSAVHLIKSTKAKSLERYGDCEFIIYDSPPGTTCPAIAAMEDSDFIVIVAEPTPFGYNDFLITYEVLKQLEIEFGVVINKFGIGDNSIENFCQKKNIEILAKIPHRVDIAQNYSKGNIFKDKNFELLMDEAFNNIVRILNK